MPILTKLTMGRRAEQRQRHRDRQRYDRQIDRHADRQTHTGRQAEQKDSQNFKYDQSEPGTHSK